MTLNDGMGGMKQIWKYPVLWFFTGMCYSELELLARGVTYLPMTFIGGMAVTLVGAMTRRHDAPSLKMWQVSALGMLVILDVEYISGCFFNLRMHMDLWSYAGDRFNLNGQVCLKNALIWFFLVPLAVWVNEFLRWKLFDEPRPPAFWQYYQRLFTLR